MAKPWERDWGNTGSTEAVVDKPKPWERQWGSTPTKADVIKPEEPPVEAAPERTVAGTVGDIGTATLKGITAVPQAAIGLTDVVSGGETGKYVQENVVDLEALQKELSKGYSPAQQAALEKVNEAKGFGGTLHAVAENPSVAASTLVESAPQMFLMGAGSKALQAAKLIKSGALAMGTSEAALMTGSAAEKMRAESPDELLTGKKIAAALGTGVVGGAFGVLGNKVATHFGGTDIVGAMMGNARKAAVKVEGEIANTPGYFKRTLASAFGEGALEEMPQSASEKMFDNYANDKPLLEGVPESAAQGLAIGAAAGPVLGGLHGKETPTPKIPPPPEATTETSTPVDPVVAKTENIIQKAKTATEELLANTPSPEGIATPETGATPTAEEQIAHAERNTAIREDIDRAARWGLSDRTRLYKMIVGGGLKTVEGVNAIEEELLNPEGPKVREGELAKDLDEARANLGMEPSPQAAVVTPVTKPTVTEAAKPIVPAIPEAHIEHAINTVATIREGLARPNAPEIKTIPNMLRKAVDNLKVDISPNAPITEVVDAVDAKIKETQQPQQAAPVISEAETNAFKALEAAHAEFKSAKEASDAAEYDITTPKKERKKLELKVTEALKKVREAADTHNKAKEAWIAPAPIAEAPIAEAPITPKALTKEDKLTEDLLAKEGTPTTITNQLRKIAKWNGVPIEGSHTPNTVIDNIRTAYEAKKTTPPPTAADKTYTTRGAAQREITADRNPELSDVTHEPLEVGKGKYMIARRERATGATTGGAGTPPITPTTGQTPAGGVSPSGRAVETAIADIRRNPVKAKRSLLDYIKLAWNSKLLSIDYIQVMTMQADARYINQLRRRLVKLGLPPTLMQKIMLEASSSQTVRDTSIAAQAMLQGTMVYNKADSKWDSVSKEGENLDAIHGSLIRISQKYNETETQTREIFNTLMKGRRVLGMYKAADAIRAEAVARGKVDGAAYLKENKALLELPEAMNMSREKAQLSADILLERPEFSEPIEIWDKVRKNVIKVMVDSGRFTLSQAENYLAVAEYVPFYRVMTITDDEKLEEAFIGMSRGSAGGINKNQKLHKIKGKTGREVDDILLNMEQWMLNSFSMSVRAQKGRTLVDLAMDWMPEGTVEKLNRNGEGVTRIFRNGNEEFYRFEDPLILFAFSGIPTISNPTVKFIAKFANIFRKSIILDPIFTLAQIPQDTFEVMFTSGVKWPLKLIPGVISEFAKSLTPGINTKAFKELKKKGIVGVRDYTSTSAREEADISLGLLAKKKGVLQHLHHAFETFSMKGDNAVRQAVYNRTMKETGSQALAVERASEIINFRRRGASANFDAFRQTIPFFGAYWQVQNVALKTLSGVGISPTDRRQAFNTLLGTSVQLLSLQLIYNLLRADDDDYQKLDQRYKNTHIVLKSGDQPSSIPLRAGIFTLPFAVANAGFDIVMNKGTTDPDAARKGISDALLSVVAGPPMGPSLVKPLTEVTIKHDFFTGRSIVGPGLEGLETSEKYTPTTSELAKLLGRLNWMAPVNIDHILRGTLGYAGSAMMTLSNIAASEAFSVPLPAKTTMDWVREIPGMSAFVGKDIPSGDLTKFYEAQTDVQGAVKTYNRLVKEDAASGKSKAENYEAEGKNEFLLQPNVRKALSKINIKLNAIREKEKEIIQVPYSELSAKEKQAELKQLALDKNEAVSEISEIRRASQGLD